jgi:putative transposase
MKLDPFIEAEKIAGHSVTKTCGLFEVSRSAYYQRAIGAPSDRARTDTELTGQISEIFHESKGTYGSPRVHQELGHRGVVCGRRRVTRLMRLAGLEGRCKKRWRKTTVADPEAEAAKDLIQRHFGPCQEIDRRYVGDITYVATWEGWAYLATVIDLASRKVAGWSLADHMRTELVEDALTMAFANRRPERGVIFHSDRGCRIYEHRLRRSGQTQRCRAVRRAEGRVLGQRRRRIVLRHHQARTHRHEVLADESRAPPRRLRVHRRLVQHPPTALDPRLPQSQPV